QLQTGAKFVHRTLRFELGEVAFAEGTDNAVDALGEVLIAYPDITLDLFIHTDNQNPEPDNIALAQSQGRAIATYLQDMRSIDPGRLRIIAVGGAEPLLPNINRRNRMINR